MKETDKFKEDYPSTIEKLFDEKYMVQKEGFKFKELVLIFIENTKENRDKFIKNHRGAFYVWYSHLEIILCTYDDSGYFTRRGSCEKLDNKHISHFFRHKFSTKEENLNELKKMYEKDKL